MNIVVGIDAGNSKTWALAGDRMGRVLGWGKAGRGNHQAPEVGMAGAVAAFAAAVEGALAEAVARLEAGAAQHGGSGANGMAAPVLAHAAFCVAGADLPQDYEQLRAHIGARWPGLSFSVHNDTIAGLAAGARRGYGAVVICGSGTCAAGRGKDGRTVQVGGLGYWDGDFGGGGDLGREAIRAALQAAQGRGRPTRLLPMVLAALGQPDPDALRAAIYNGRLPAGYALSLAPLVFEAANAGDEVAQDILIRMGTELGKAAAAALKAVGLEREPGVEVVLAGSVWKGQSPLLVDACRLALHREAPGAVLVYPRYEPVVGAYLVALAESGTDLTPAVLANLEATLPADLWLAREPAGRGGP